MSEYEKLQSLNEYTAPPPYNPQEYPPPGFQQPQQIIFAQPQTSAYAQQVLQPQPQPQPQPQIIATTTTVIQTAGFGESPTQTMCPKCQRMVMTRVSNECSNCQHLLCCCMFLTGICTLFSCLPYCCCGCANVRHECSQCGRHLGTYTR